MLHDQSSGQSRGDRTVTGSFDFASQPAPQPLPIADRAKAVSVALTIWIVMAVLSGLHSLTLLAPYSELAEGGAGSSAAEEQLTQLTYQELGVAGVAALVNLAAGLTYLVWLYRARDNAERMSSMRHRRSRTWLTLAWLVPIVNFWFPYQIVADIRAASLRGEENSPDTPPSLNLLSWWWALYLLNSFGVLFVFAFTSATPETVADVATDARNSLLLQLVLIPAGIVAAVLAVRVVRGISALQAGEPTRHPQ
jgi:hypothetical protein